MRKVTDKEIEAVLQLDGGARFKRFVKSVAGSEQAWGLWNDGWALLADNVDSKVFPLWPEREYAELCRIADWSEYEAKPITIETMLEDLLPRLDAESIRIGVFPRPVSNDTATCDGTTLSSALREELQRYE